MYQVSPTIFFLTYIPLIAMGTLLLVTEIRLDFIIFKLLVQNEHDVCIKIFGIHYFNKA